MNTTASAKELSSPKASVEVFRNSLPSPKPVSPSECLLPSRKAAGTSEVSVTSSPLRANFQGLCSPPSPTLTCRVRASNSRSPVRKSSHSASAFMSRSSIEEFVSGSHISSAMETLSFYAIVASETSSSPVARSSRWVSDLGTERPPCDQLSGDECPSTPRAPVKLNRHRSVKPFFPGKTRRKLDFDEL